MKQLKSKPNKAIPEALVNFNQLPDSAYIRLPVLQRLYGISASSCWRGIKNGTIPHPVKMSERCTAWNVGIIRAALAAKAIA